MPALMLTFNISKSNLGIPTKFHDLSNFTNFIAPKNQENIEYKKATVNFETPTFVTYM